MTRADRIVRLGLAGSVVLLGAMPAFSASRSDQPLQVWSAMQGIAPAALLEDVHALPLSEMAIDDQPYCAADQEIAETLTTDFNEVPVDHSDDSGTELWGSDQLGTWTLVAPRADDTSCIIASGIGFTADRQTEAYYTVAGL